MIIAQLYKFIKNHWIVHLNEWILYVNHTSIKILKIRIEKWPILRTQHDIGTVLILKSFNSGFIPERREMQEESPKLEYKPPSNLLNPWMAPELCTHRGDFRNPVKSSKRKDSLKNWVEILATAYSKGDIF